MKLIARGDIGVYTLAKAMDKVRPSELGWIRPLWKPLVRSRTGVLTRIMLFLR